MERQNIDPTNVIVPVDFDAAARASRLASEIAALPKGQQGFFGLHLVVDKRHGGLKRDDEGNPITYPRPDNPFIHDSSDLA